MQVSAQTVRFEKKQQPIYSKWQSAINVKMYFFLATHYWPFATSCVKYHLRFMWERRRSCMWEAELCRSVGLALWEISCCAAGGRAVLSNDASGALFSVCISQLYRPQKHIDMRTKGKGEITAAFVQKAKKAQFLCSFIQKKAPSAPRHLTLFITY